MGTRTAVVAGGGIGGLAAAIALSRKGWQVQVLERAAEFREVGAGLTLWPNALRALDRIGLGDQLRALGTLEGTTGIRDSRGRWLTRTDTDETTRLFGPAVVVHRAELLDVLVSAVPQGVLRAGVEVTGARQVGGKVIVTHTGGEQETDLLVGADGIRSVVRGQFWPGTNPVYSGVTSWRMVPHRTDRLDVGGEYWGRGEEFGLLQLPGDVVYCFAAALAPEGARSADGELAELKRRFGTWVSPIPELLDLVQPETVLRYDLYYLPRLPSYVDGRVALLGDAAHAMMPNLGQAACQALEDAVTLAEVADDLAAYDRLRRKRSQLVARLSRSAGKVGLVPSPMMATLRDNGMRLMPTSVMLRSFRRLFDWAPPEVTAARPHREPR